MKPSLLVLAAGMGSRYGGVKQIDPVGMHGETLLDYSVFDARRAGYGKVVFIIRPDIEKDFRERLFDRIARNMDAEYVFQTRESLLTEEQIKASQERQKPWGTIHAVICAKDAVKTPFTVINADDYYGREAYKILGDYLSKLDNNSDDHAMVGYFLKNTMSPVGSVSRGVCQVKDGLLQGMRENTKIEFEGNKIVSHLPEGDVYLTGDEWVSMNFFGFSPKVFGLMCDYFERFMKDNASQPKAEVLLPNFAGEMVQTGKGRKKVLSTTEKRFGMTYKEDRETVKQNLAQKTREGIYPERLWEK
ncbi:MAG: NTP transferase domain-containing protein [Spirochaetales bacterium]|nr:NTP transferase domain-containing protein [Spirochaetales bacterium]